MFGCCKTISVSERHVKIADNAKRSYIRLVWWVRRWRCFRRSKSRYCDSRVQLLVVLIETYRNPLK